MKFNFISVNLSLFSCINYKESLISSHNKSYGLNNRNIWYHVFFIYISVKEDTLYWILFKISMKNIILSLTTEQFFFNNDSLSLLSVLISFMTTYPVHLSYFKTIISDNLSSVFAPKKTCFFMKFNIISDNLSLFSCILVKDNLISLYNKSYGINNRNIVIVISCVYYISVKEDTLLWILFYISMKNIILSMTTQQTLFYQWQLVSFFRVNFVWDNLSRAFDYF